MAEVSLQREAGEEFGRLTPRDALNLVTALAAAGTLCLVAMALMTHHEHLFAFSRGECDLRGHWQYEPPHRVEPAVVAAIDHRAVHGSLLPRWVTAAAHRLDDPELEVSSFEELRAAVSEDPNLTELLDRQRWIITEEMVLARAERLHYLVWAWNRYLEAHGQPFVVEGSVGIGWGRRPFFYIVTYETVADLSVDVGAEPCRVRLVQRADPVNVRELHVGGAGTTGEGAVVVTDRLQDFAFDAVWPLLAEAPAGPGADMGPYAEAVAREVETGIGAEHTEVLRRTARLRSALLETAEAVAERQPCSDFAIVETPFDGYDERGIDRIVGNAYLSLGAFCPRVKVEEAVLAHKISHALREEPGLRPALEALVAWLARTVAVHEARHLADLDGEGGLRIACSECGSDSVTAEVSAYLASFAWGEGPATAYYQACRAVRSERNPHAAAMEVVDQWLDRECVVGPPTDLAAEARRLEEDHLGRSDEITVPADFPRRLPLDRDAGRRRAVVDADRADWR